MQYPNLSIIIWLPALGALIMLFFPKSKDNWFRYFSVAWAVISFLSSIPLLIHYDRNVSGIQMIQNHEWIPLIGARYILGVDGITMVLILLTTILGVVACLCSWNYIQERNKEYYIFILLLQTGMIGTFCAMDMFLFYVFWEVMLVPMYFLIGIWGSENRLYAAIKFFLYTLAGSVVMLLGILKLYFIFPNLVSAHSAQLADIATTMSTSQSGLVNDGMKNLIMQGLTGAQASGFNIMSLQAIGHFIDPGLQVWLFAAFGLAFAIKVPMFPFHTWLPDAHVQAPTAGSVILAGVLLKFGTYGFLRFNLPIFPDASRNPKVVTVMLLLSVIGIVYGALVAMAQKDMKKLIAYSSVSHMGMIMLGIFALNPIGLNGAITQMLNHGISTSALFLIVGVLYERRHTREIAQYGGISSVMPSFAVLFLIMTLSSIGLPLLNGFIGEFLILNGAFGASSGWWQSYSWTFVAALGIILGAAYMLWLYQRVMFGKITNDKNLKLTDLNIREMIYFAPLVVLAFWIGLYPSPVLSYYSKSVDLISYQSNPKTVDNPLGYPKPSEINKLAQTQPQPASQPKMLLPPAQGQVVAPTGVPGASQPAAATESGH